MRVYVDNAATTPLSPRVLEAMMPFLTEDYANASAIYTAGIGAKNAKEAARSTVAAAIGARQNEIYFTSGGTESDNWALLGSAELRRGRDNCKHIITTAIEHSAVLHTAERLEAMGYDVTYLKPDKLGQITPEQVCDAMRDDTFLISVMLANNEVGTILPVREITAAARARRRDVIVHTDAVQAAGHIPINVKELGVDFLSISAHKFRGPKGMGAIYMRVPYTLPPMIYGGGQEKGRRSGTENIAGIVGLASALDESVKNLAVHTEYLLKLRDMLIGGVLEKIPGSYLTGDPKNRLPGAASFVFDGIPNQPIIVRLDEDHGICASQGSACSAGSGDPSRVLLAMGYPEELARASLRLTLGEQNTTEEVEYILTRLPATVELLRAAKPLIELIG